MTATQRFIEDAIKGGWTETRLESGEYAYPDKGKVNSGGVYSTVFSIPFRGNWIQGQPLDANYFLTKYRILLDPLAWQAVGKTRGWLRVHCKGCGWEDTSSASPQHHCPYPKWQETHIYQMHRFIDHLADGKTIEEALAAIEDTKSE